VEVGDCTRWQPLSNVFGGKGGTGAGAPHSHLQIRFRRLQRWVIHSRGRDAGRSPSSQPWLSGRQSPILLVHGEISRRNYYSVIKVGKDREI